MSNTLKQKNIWNLSPQEFFLECIFFLQIQELMVTENKKS